MKKNKFLIAFLSLSLFLQGMYAQTCTNTPSSSGVSPFQTNNVPGPVACTGGIRFATAGSYNDGFGNGFTVTYSPTTCGQVASFQTTGNIVIDKMLVKGGSNSAGDVNIYTYSGATSDGNLHAPVNPSGIYSGISHIDICFHYLPLACGVVVQTKAVSCKGLADGQAKATPTGGYGGYTYLWDNGQTSASATGLSAGTHTVTIRDVKGNTVTCSVIITEPALLQAASSKGTIACNGGTTTVTVSATGGTLPYTGIGTFTVSAGAYSYTVEDANGCKSTATGTITEPPLLVAASSAGTIACYGGTTTVTVSATGGTAPYKGTGMFTVSAGTYSYTVEDANGCKATTSGTITEPPLLVAASSAGTIACYGGTTTVTVSATGGTGQYKGTGMFTVSAGTYTYTVEDANGCKATTTGTVTEPTLLVAASSAGTIACYGGTTTVTVSATGGTAPYKGTGMFTVSAGTYTYTVEDANGCKSTTTGTVTEPPLLVAASSAGTIACYGGTTTVTVSATGGTAPYKGTGMFTVSAGTYTYTVEDANGCKSTTTGTVTEPPLLVAASSAGTIACYGGTTTVTVSATGGTGQYKGTGMFTVSAGTYTYTVEDANGCKSTTTGTVTEPTLLVAASSAGTIACYGGTTTVTVSATGGTAPYKGTGMFTVSAGTYTYTVEDANGCKSTTTGTVTEPPLLVAASSAGTIACYGGTTTVTVSATGGTAPYKGTGMFTVSAGTYTYTVEDANGCKSTTTGTVTEPPLLVAASSAGTIACYGGTTTVTVSATGGTAPYKGTGMFTVSAGTYTYTVEDANGCKSTTSATVTEPTLLVAASSAGTIACYGGTTTVTVSATGGTGQYSGIGTFTVSAGPYSYTVEDANGCKSTTSGTITEPTLLVAASSAGKIACNGGTTTVTVSATGGTAPYKGTGMFTVSAGTYTYTVEDANGCKSTTTGTVTQPALLTCSASSSQSASCNGSDGVATVTPTGGTAPYSYLWDNGETGATATRLTGVAHTVQVKDANGCITTCSVTVIMKPCGCSYSQGYWGTHSKYGSVSSKRDKTWDLVGEDNQFFGSGKTNYQIFAISSGGNAYYILAKQYLATRLNLLKSVNPIILSPAAATAYASAGMYLSMYTPTTVPSNLSGTMKNLGSVLEAYITATHCGSSIAQPIVAMSRQSNKPLGSQMPTLETFPNPTINEVNLTLNNFSGDKLNIMLYDMQGAVILSKQIDNAPFYGLNIGAVVKSNGLYVIRVMDEKNSISKVLSVQK